jgi:hypothetical protein
MTTSINYTDPISGNVSVNTLPPQTAGASLPASTPSWQASSSITRVANTTTYTANTGWNTATSGASAVFSFANMAGYNGELVSLIGVDVYSNKNPALSLQGILWLFNTTPGTVISDDAAFLIAAADFANLAGDMTGIPFSLTCPQSGGPGGSASNSGVSFTPSPPVPLKLAAGSTTLYGMVLVVNAYVPASGEILTVNLRTMALN